MPQKKHNNSKTLARNATDVVAFLDEVKRTPVVRSSSQRGRLIFALDATASRQVSWDIAMDIQAQMFSQSSMVGQLSVQLAYYRGFKEFFVGQFSNNSSHILRDMTGVYCVGGRTQICRLLRHALTQHKTGKVDALVLVGDACEEDLDLVFDLAGQMGLQNLPAFTFLEGADVEGRQAFMEISRLSGGIFSEFDSSSPETLRRLLSEVAIFAVGGRKELSRFQEQSGHQLLRFTKRN